MKRKKTVTILLDDLDGSPDAETVTFALDGVRYEIELSKDNQAVLKDALAPFIKKGRRITPKAKPKSTGPDPKIVRAWAQENGIEVSAIGKISHSVIEQYLAAA